ncbi:hypothetical protein ACH4A8_38950 [Streptomyces vietnamensis]|uniref:hypothetical protein n=1 Tax=Streptomyces vietnamensis TaxID=362257 RepID=UPI0037B33A82
MTFTIGQRVRTTVDAPAGWDGAFSAPAGTLGTITGGLDRNGTYAVHLDGDPDHMDASYTADELIPA